jgi:hypothetical protein
MTTYAEYRQAAIWLWGPGGEFAADEFMRLNREHFAGSVPPLPIVIGITAYGHCLALTRGYSTPRISLGSELFNGSRARLDPNGRPVRGRIQGGPLTVSDTLIHETLHAFLMLRGEEPAHNAEPWCRMITELSQDLGVQEIKAQPVGTKRIPNPARDTDPKAPKTKVVRRPEPGYLTQDQLASWPDSIRPAGYYDSQERIPVDTY